VRCPRFVKRATEHEFQRLVSDLDEIDKRTSELKKLAEKLVDTASGDQYTLFTDE